MDLLDVVIDATLKGAVSHYVRKSLEKIDQGLGLLFRSGNREEIKKYVTDRQLIQPLTDLASQTLRGSFVVPAMPENIATFEDRAELFQHVMQFGFNVSNRLQVDLFLPGSLHSKATSTLFLRNSKSAPEVTREGNRVSLPVGTLDNKVFFFPMSYDKAQELFEFYKKKLIAHLENSSGYFDFDLRASEDGWDRCGLKAMTAGSCVFEYPNIMRGEAAKYYAPENGLVAIKDWMGGLRQMFTAVGEVPNLRYLSDEQTKEIKDAYELFQRLN